MMERKHNHIKYSIKDKWKNIPIKQTFLNWIIYKKYGLIVFFCRKKQFMNLISVTMYVQNPTLRC